MKENGEWNEIVQVATCEHNLIWFQFNHSIVQVFHHTGEGEEESVPSRMQNILVLQR